MPTSNARRAAWPHVWCDWEKSQTGQNSEINDMKNDTVSKEIQYQELIADVQKAYLSESRELRWCEECKEINLWAYWQGRGHLDADIMLVGQDWGCPWDTPSVATMKNVCDMNCGKVVSYMRRNDSITDKNLIQLFRTIGFDILSDNPKLFFTNLVMGYRLQGTSGGFKATWANADAPFFRRLVDIIHPRILLCLGKDTFRCTLRALGLQRLPVIRNYNRFIESSENPVQIHLCDDETAFVFAFAHCGVMGTLNRNRGTNEKASLNKQIQDWAKIVPFLCVT